MYLEMVIERIQRYIGSPSSSESGDALGDQDWVNFYAKVV